MPRTAASNGIRPEIRALAVLQLGKTVSPAEINAHVGTGDYAAKYVSFLNTRYGFTITANKDGRKVVSYTVVAEPSNAADLRAATPKVKIAKPAAKAKSVAKVLGLTKTETKAIRAEVAAEKAAEIKAKNLATLKAVAAKKKAAPKKKVREFDDVTEQFGTSGEVGTSFNVDRDWDSIEGLDLSKLL